jgi:hypothetical protein
VSSIQTTTPVACDGLQGLESEEPYFGFNWPSV